MNKYINFFPGNTRDAQELSVNDFAAHHLDDVAALVDSMIAGCACSAPLKGAIGAIEDGSLWVSLCAKYGDADVQGSMEEIHALIKSIEQ